METYIKAVPPSATNRTTAQLMKTGQTTSYRTGDDGDLEAGRNFSFTILAENNPFGNTNRFTDELGGSTYTNDIVIDWSTYNGGTVLGWYRVNNGVNITWANAIDGALAVSIGTFTSGWRLPNIQEIFSIITWNATYRFNYVPFNIDNTFNFWTSTTDPLLTTRAIQITNTNYINIALKTSVSSARYIPCRTFTVTGTTLS